LLPRTDALTRYADDRTFSTTKVFPAALAVSVMVKVGSWSTSQNRASKAPASLVTTLNYRMQFGDSSDLPGLTVNEKITWPQRIYQPFTGDDELVSNAGTLRHDLVDYIRFPRLE